MVENKIKCFECGKKYNPNEIKMAICKKCDKKLEMPINKKVYFGITFFIFIICGIFWWEFLSTFLIGLCTGLLFGVLYFSKSNKQSPTSQTSPNGDFSKEKEHNMGLEASAQEPTPKLSPTEITSPNLNIMFNLRGRLQSCEKL